MYVNMDKIKIGLANYIEQEIVKQAESGKAKYLYSFAKPRAVKLVEKYINKNRDNPFVEDLFDERGDVNLDELYDEAVEASRQTGRFEFFGIWVSEDTFKTIYSYIAR